jgi:hypothetical protein
MISSHDHYDEGPDFKTGAFSFSTPVSSLVRR